MSCHDEENYMGDRRTALTTLESHTAPRGYVCFGLLSWVRQLLPVFVLSLQVRHPALSSFLQQLPPVKPLRRVLLQHRKVVFVVLFCQLERDTTFVPATGCLPTNSSLRSQLLHGASNEAAGLALRGRHWASYLPSWNGVLDAECLHSRKRAVRVPFQSCEQCFSEEGVRHPFAGRPKVFFKPSSRSPHLTDESCSFTSASSSSVFSGVYASRPEWCGCPAFLVNYPYSCVRVRTACESSCVPEVRRIIPLRVSTLHRTAREGMCTQSGTAVAPRVDDNSLRQKNSSELLAQPASKGRACASPIALHACPPAATCASTEASAGAVECLLPCFTGAATVYFRGRRLLRSEVRKRRSGAVTVATTVTALPGTITCGAVRGSCLTSVQTKAAGGVLWPGPSSRRPAALWKVSCGYSSPVNQKPNSHAALSGPREGECFEPSGELQMTPSVEGEFKTAAALLQDERLDSDRRVDTGEDDRNTEKEARQRSYHLVRKRREIKPKKQGKKEIRLTPRIAAHDLLVKAKQARQFLLEKKQVLFSVHLRGRELAACSLHRVLLERVAEMLDDVAAPTNAIQQKGNSLMQLFQYRKQKKTPTSPKVPNAASLREATSSAACRAAECLESGPVNQQPA